jgi:N-acetylmuramoyl-L-alanine amidase
MLNKINKIVLFAGHGGGDSGAVNKLTGATEALNTKIICESAFDYLNKMGRIEVEYLDPSNNWGLATTIQQINKKYQRYSENKNNNVLCLEIHQDMYAPHLEDEKESKQMGVYYYNNDALSLSIADNLCRSFIKYGAYNVNDNNLSNFNGTWRQDHYLENRKFNLGFIHNTKPLSMIIECGFISAPHTENDLKRFGYWIAQAIHKAKTGLEYDVDKNVIVLQDQEDMKLQQAKSTFISMLDNSQSPYIRGTFKQTQLKKAIERDDFQVVFNEFFQSFDEILKKDVKIAELSEQKMLSEVSTPTFRVKQENTNFDNLILQNANFQNGMQEVINKQAESKPNFRDIISNIFTFKDQTLERHVHSTIKALLIAFSSLLVNQINQKTGYNLSIDLFNSVININQIVDVLTSSITYIFTLISSNNAFSSYQDLIRNRKNNG